MFVLTAGRPLVRLDPNFSAAVALGVSLTPFLARLGAKRPQYHAWDFIVASFLLVLFGAVLAVMARGRSDHLPSLFQIVMAVGIAMQWFDNVLTPGVVAATLFGTAQILLLGTASGYWSADAGTAVWSLQVVACALVVRRYYLGPAPPRGWHGVWQSFRNRYGVLWSLRVRERCNADAERAAWPWRLTWDGWVHITPQEHPTSAPVDEPLLDDGAAGALETAELDPVVARAFRHVLQRFVEPAWIDERIEPRTERSGEEFS